MGAELNLEAIPLTALVFWLIYITGTGAALLYPLAGVLLYILVYHLHPETQWWGHSIRAIGLRTSMTVAVAIVIGILARRPRFGPGGRQFPLPFTLSIALVLLALGSLIWGYGISSRGIYQAEKIVKVMIFVLILIRCVRQPRHYHLAIIAWLAGVFYLGYEAFGQAGGLVSGRLSLGLGGPDFAESSGLAVHLVASLPLIGAMFFMARHWWSRGMVLMIGALTVNTIVMTRTRNAIVGIVAMCVVAAFSLPRKYRAKGWAAIVVGALLATQLADPTWWKRMATVSAYSEDSAVTSRIAYWRAALEMTRDYPLGIGIGNFHQVVKEYVPGLAYTRSAHNTLVACLAELGIPGLIVFLAIIGVALHRLTLVRRQANRLDPLLPIEVAQRPMRFHLGWHAMALRTALVGYLACGLFTTRLYTEGFWILVGLACCLDNVAAGIFAQTDRRDAPDALTSALPVPPAMDEPDAPPVTGKLQ